MSIDFFKTNIIINSDWKSRKKIMPEFEEPPEEGNKEKVQFLFGIGL